MTETIRLKAERFVSPNKIFSGVIEYQDGKITEILPCTSDSVDYYFGKKYLVFPGFIDQHVHLRYGQPEKEDIISGTLAAINGGVTRVMDMPNNPVDIAPLTKETLEAKVEWGNQGFVPVHHYAATKPGAMPIPGIDHYKVFIGKSVGDLWFETEEQIFETLKNYSGKNITFHCEMQSKIDNTQKTHTKRRPPLAEELAFEIAEKVCEEYDIIGNIAHVSTNRPLSSSQLMESTFHHMLLNADNSSKRQVNPPLRSPHLRKNIRESARCGITDFIASDHAPHTLEEKLGSNPLSGMPMLDTYGNCAGHLIKEFGFAPERISELCSYNPALWIFSNTNMESGNFAKGYDASFTVINMKKKTSMFNHEIYSKAGYTPFSGMTMPEVTATIAQGRILKEDNRVFC